MRYESDRHSTSLLSRLAVIVVVALSVVGAFIGSGVLGGTAISEAAGGWLSTDATPLAPDTGAFRVWSVIYIGLVGYAAWQLSSPARASSRQRSLRPWAIASAVLNAAWVWSIQLDSLTASVAVIIALLAVLLRILVLMGTSPPANRLDAVFTDGTFGLYLGWVCVATAANVAAWLAALGLSGFAAWPSAAVGVVIVVAVLGVSLAMWTCGRIAPALTIAWGLAWIAAARTDGVFASPLLVWVAAFAALVVLVAVPAVRWRSYVRRRAPGPKATGESA